MADWSWRAGTAYDLFASLYVLVHPQQFGVRKAWAAGVRARLPHSVRPVLERLAQALPLPFPWVAGLPEPRDAATAIRALRALPPEQRLPALFWAYDTPLEAREVYAAVQRRGSWTPEDLTRLEGAYRATPVPPRRSVLEMRLSVWAEAEAFAQALPEALQSYVACFFGEEEPRVRQALPPLQMHAEAVLRTRPLPQAVPELTQGVQFPQVETVQQLLLAPSFWLAPLAVFRRVGPEAALLVFGARPEGVSLVPGAEVPDGVTLGLQALAEPTRLRILRLLAERPHTPSQLAHRLRLRPPTVVHHLHALRLAGLVYLTVQEGGRRFYAARLEHLRALWGQLETFLASPKAEPDDRS